MDITQLRYFLRTAETLNYSRAAESLFITRQSLRQAVANLEEELGAPLFRNDRNHLSLTECGTFLALRGVEVIRDFDALCADTARLAQRQVKLRVAFSESLSPLLLPDLPKLLQRFRTQFPHVPLEVFRWDMDRVVEAAEAGEVDCGCVLQMPCEHPGCKMWKLETFPALLDYGQDSPLRNREEGPFLLKELEGVPCIGMGSPQRFLRPLWEDCRRQGIWLNYQAEPNTINTFYQIQNSLAAGFDIFMGEPLQDGQLGNRPIYAIPLPEYTFDLVLLCPERRPNAGLTELFCRFFAEQLRAPVEEP